MTTHDSLLALAALAGALRDALAGDPRWLLADRLVASVAALLADATDRERSRRELRQLADTVREASRDLPQLAARAVRLKELVSILLAADPIEAGQVPRRDDYGREISP